MKATLVIFVVFCLALVCPAAVGQEATFEDIEETVGRVPELALASAAEDGILSVIPADAYGFVATNNLQGSYDNVMLFVQALGLPIPRANILLTIQEHVGEIDLDAPGAIILLDVDEMSEPKAALLLSAVDAKAVVESHRATARGVGEEMPPGVVKIDVGYLAATQGFVVLGPNADDVASVLAGQGSHQIMPAAKAAFEQGQIVLAGDLQRAGPLMMQMVDMAQGKMAQNPMSAMPQMASTMEMFSLYFDGAKSLIQQSDKLTVVLDINAEHAILSKAVLFKADSEIAAFVNAQKGQPVASYSALPGGPFLMAGGVNMATEGMQSLVTNVLEKFMTLPSFKGGLPEEQVKEYVADINAGIAQLSGYSFTMNLGNPMTGMLNAVARYDVSDSASYLKLMEKVSSGEAARMWSKGFGAPIEYVYTSAGENYSGVEIDTIKMVITPPEPPAEDDPMAMQKQMMMAQQMQMLPMMYGPDMTFRMAAPNDKQVLFVMGGSGRMERAINVAQGNGTVLADSPKIAQAVAKLPANRFAEFHLDLGQVVPMIGMFASMAGGPAMPAAEAPATPLISWSVSAEANALRVDMVVPSETVRMLVQTAMAMQMQMMQQQMESGGQAEPSEDF